MPKFRPASAPRSPVRCPNERAPGAARESTPRPYAREHFSHADRLPMLGSSAHTENTMTLPTATDLTSIIGQEMKDASIQKVLAKVPGPSKREKSDDTVYYTYKDFGLEVVEDADTGRIASLFLRPKGRSNQEYGGELPEKLSFGMSQPQIRATLGDPDKENGPAEDQWDRGAYRLGVKFDKKGRVEFIYLSAM